jgi:type IV secretion system protein VirB9
VKSVLSAFMAMSLLSGTAFAETTPHFARADRRLRMVTFEKDNVVVLSGVMGVSTMIVFDEDAGERIATLAMGDSKSWQAVPDQDKRYLFIKPLEPDAATNMTVVTNLHIYSFALRAMATGSTSPIYKLRFVYPDDGVDKNLLAEARGMTDNPLLQKLWAHPEAINSRYDYKGQAINKPSRVVDDGVHTYFQFSGEIPAIFRVKKDMSETLVNYRREGDVIIVDGVAAQWTLRNGSQATCIFNLAAVAEPPPATSMEPIVQSPPTPDTPISPTADASLISSSLHGGR